MNTPDAPRIWTRTSGCDWDVIPVGLALWITALGRVLISAYHQRVFDADSTLAFACVVAIPFLLVPRRRSHTASR